MQAGTALGSKKYKGDHNVRVQLAGSEDREVSINGFFMNRGTMNEKEKQYPESACVFLLDSLILNLRAKEKHR